MALFPPGGPSVAPDWAWPAHSGAELGGWGPVLGEVPGLLVGLSGISGTKLAPEVVSSTALPVEESDSSDHQPGPFGGP